MNTLIHADIFFFVTTICLVVFAILGIIAWVYIIKILANIRSLTDKARVEGEYIIEEIGHMREKIHRTSGIMAFGSILKSIISKFGN